jgi:hypothetical protein
MIPPYGLNWITYDGTRDTHPESNTVLVYTKSGRYEIADFFTDGDDFSSLDIDLQPGDMWAFLE